MIRRKSGGGPFGADRASRRRLKHAADARGATPGRLSLRASSSGTPSSSEVPATPRTLAVPLIPGFCESPPAPTDLDGAAARQELQALLARCIVSPGPDGCLQPRAPMTHEQFAQLLDRAGLARGSEEGAARPAGGISLQEAVSVLVSRLGLETRAPDKAPFSALGVRAEPPFHAAMAVVEVLSSCPPTHILPRFRLSWGVHGTGAGPRPAMSPMPRRVWWTWQAEDGSAWRLPPPRQLQSSCVPSAQMRRPPTSSSSAPHLQQSPCASWRGAGGCGSGSPRSWRSARS